MTKPHLPADSITTLPYDQRLVVIRERYGAMAYSGPTTADRERDTVIGYLLDRIESPGPVDEVVGTQWGVRWPNDTVSLMGDSARAHAKVERHEALGISRTSVVCREVRTSVGRWITCARGQGA